MLISKANKKQLYSYLFKEGVIVVKKDVEIMHKEVNLPNLQVLVMMKSLKSRGFVREAFNWVHYFFFLTDEGINYLRTFLNLPEEVVPATLQKVTRPMEKRPEGGMGGGDREDRRGGGGGRGRGGPRSDRDEYRRDSSRPFSGSAAGAKKTGPEGAFTPAFRGGGRGAGGAGSSAGGAAATARAPGTAAPAAAAPAAAAAAAASS